MMIYYIEFFYIKLLIRLNRPDPNNTNKRVGLGYDFTFYGL